MNQEEEIARKRWMVMQIVRITGIALLLAGLAIGLGRTSLPRELGYVLVLVGFFDAVVMPIVLAKRWKSPPP